MKFLLLGEFEKDKPTSTGTSSSVLQLVEYGKKLGHEVIYSDKPIKGDFDLYIFDAIRANLDAMSAFCKELIDNKKKFVKVEHDYEFCNYRVMLNGVYPCDECHKPCREKLIPFYKDLFELSELVVFMSPGHRDIIQSVLGNSYKFVCIPPFIDTSVFKNQNTPRDLGTVVYSGYFAYHKGMENMINFARANPKLYFYFCGDDNDMWTGRSYVPTINLLGNSQHIKWVEPKKLAEIFAMSEFVMAYSECYETFCKSVVEGYLCGCKILRNDNIGAFSYDWDWDDGEEVRKNIEDAPKQFWGEMVKCC